MRKLFLILMTMAACAWGLQAQTRTISGTVLDAADNEPLIGATVAPIGGGQGAAADIDGKFTIKVPANVTKARVSYVGYETKTVDLKDGMVVHLAATADALDEVMVVAYGTAKKSEYTGSASVVDASTIEDRLVTNVANALNGTVSGVQTLSNNGQPGEAPSIRIRGVGSINASTSPLWVLDGVPFEGDIAAVNPSDIESMTVLKDAAAAALYGARGANGVILVTTKRGKRGEARVTVDMKWGANSPATPYYDVIENREDYLGVAFDALRLGAIYTGSTPDAAFDYANSQLFDSQGVGYQIYTIPDGEGFFVKDANGNKMVNPNASLGYTKGDYYFIPDDWKKCTLRNGMRQEYNVSVSGATDKLSYYISGGYVEDQGLINNSDYQRLTARTNIDYQVKPWLKIGSNVTYTHSEQNYPGDQTTSNSSGNAFMMAYSLAPVYPMFVRDAEGNIMYNEIYGQPIYDYGKPTGKFNTGQTRPLAAYSGSNPVGQLLYDKVESLTDIINGKWMVELTPIDGLRITGNASLNIEQWRGHNTQNPIYGFSADWGGYASMSNNRYRMLTLQALANYRKTFAEKHTIDLLAGYEQYEYNIEYLGASGNNPYQKLSWAVDNTLNDTKRTGWGSSDNYATRGIFFRANYDFESRYFFSGSFRRDGSSRFHPSHRWGNFFSISGAWDVAKENFMEGTRDWLNQLKFRASFGQQGNDGIGGWYAWADQYEISGDKVWADGKLNYKGNKDLTWETSNNFNVGLDFVLWNNKLFGTLEYFSRQTSDMLYYRPVASSLGYSSIPMNVGSIRNSGMELELTYTPIRTKDLEWSITGNLTYINSKVLKLAPELGGFWQTASNVYIEGQSMYQWYLGEFAGLDPATGRPLYWQWDWQKDSEGKFILDKFGQKIMEPGTERVSSEYKSEFRRPQGNSLPPVYGGFGTNLSWKGIDFGISFGYQIGGKAMDYGYSGLINPGQGTIGSQWSADIFKAWTPENPNTTIPRMNAQEGVNYIGSTNYFMVDASYLSLNNITLGYTLPQSLTRKIKLESVRIYGAADNVALWSARKGFDPRQGYWGANANTYTGMRCISGGIKVVF